MKTPDWLRAWLEDPSVTDICINGGSTARVDSRAGTELHAVPAPDTASAAQWARDWAVHQLASAGKTWDAKQPYADATIAPSHRLHVVFPPVAPAGVMISLRRLPYGPGGAPGERGSPLWRNDPAFATLAEAVRRKETLLISGATGSGKTTLASDLLAEIPADERVIALEDTPELRPGLPQFATLVARPPNADGYGEVSLRDLLRQSLRMRPDRIVLGECRGPEVLDLLQCLNTGHQGALATLHANSARDALRRIELLCLLAAGGSIPPKLIRELLAHGVRWIAHVQRTGGIRRITEILRIEGLEGDTLLTRPMLKGIHAGDLHRAS